MLDWLAETFLKRSILAREDEIRARYPLFYQRSFWGSPLRFQLEVIGAEALVPHWQHCILSVEGDGLHLYPLRRKADIQHHFARDSLRWFGRPVKYKPGRNEMWLHFEAENHWLLLKLQLYHGYMVTLVRQMKLIATPEQVTAYRRRRPYIHHGLSSAHHASQDLHGAWTLHAPLALYLMPSHLVLIDSGRVERALPLETVQEIEVMRRLDAPDAHGIVRFKAGGESLAFALADYLSFGEALGEAAKRSLEAPPVFYGKKKDDDEDEWEE